MEEVKGYKAFNKNATNRYGISFIEGQTYRFFGRISFGNNGNGLHLCTTLADVFRYVDAIDDEVLVASVTGRGQMVSFNDEYFGYYDMYAVEELTVDKFLTRREILDKMLEASEFDVKKFMMTFKLSLEEAYEFLNKFASNYDILLSILYYQFGYKDIYEKKDDMRNEQIRKVLKYGQDNNKRS